MTTYAVSSSSLLPSPPCVDQLNLQAADRSFVAQTSSSFYKVYLSTFSRITLFIKALFLTIGSLFVTYRIACKEAFTQVFKGYFVEKITSLDDQGVKRSEDVSLAKTSMTFATLPSLPASSDQKETAAIAPNQETTITPIEQEGARVEVPPVQVASETVVETVRPSIEEGVDPLAPAIRKVEEVAAEPSQKEKKIKSPLPKKARAAKTASFSQDLPGVERPQESVTAQKAVKVHTRPISIQIAKEANNAVQKCGVIWHAITTKKEHVVDFGPHRLMETQARENWAAFFLASFFAENMGYHLEEGIERSCTYCSDQKRNQLLKSIPKFNEFLASKEIEIKRLSKRSSWEEIKAKIDVKGYMESLLLLL